eukprot:CAMPEP_0172161108 /NCGR_PEP_ID=MMETSP1050-20130122/5938_1 /TAXON_ID=233186 /ORGANISM="Cryptomonas curvata, Strain CCAP979/52" /LENGTH=94 /DNA_ID=CAMNT_0012830961 /DNA_START=471 /DNA_END=752 /DNA_ORIENTATION=+
MVKRILPPQPSDVAAYSSSQSPFLPRKATTPRGAHDSRPSQPRAHQPARTLWILPAELGGAGWGSFTGKRDAFAGLRVLVERMPDVGRHLPPPE